MCQTLVTLMDLPPAEAQTTMESANADVPDAQVASPPVTAPCPAVSAVFACHDLLVEIALHLAPDHDVESRDFRAPGGYRAIERFTRVSRACREAGIEALYSSIYLWMCNLDATLLLLRTLEGKPHLGTLVRSLDATSRAGDAGPTFGWRAVILLLECMPNIVRIRTSSSEVTGYIESPKGPARLEDLLLDSGTGDRNQWHSQSDVMFTEAEVRLMSRTRRVDIAGNAGTILRGPSAMPTGLDKAPSIRSLHLKGCAFSPQLLHNLLRGCWAGVITSLSITDVPRTDGGTSTWAARWKDVIQALQSSLTHLRIDTTRVLNKPFKEWQMDLTHVSGLLRLELFFSSTAMPDAALLPLSLHFLEIRARSPGTTLRNLLQRLSDSNCLPALRAVPCIMRPQPPRSVETLQHEETVYAARDEALTHLQARGLFRMRGGDQYHPQIWDESAQAHREAVLAKLAGLSELDEDVTTTGMWAAEAGGPPLPNAPQGHWLAETGPGNGNAWDAGDAWGGEGDAEGGEGAWGWGGGGLGWGAAQGANAAGQGWGDGGINWGAPLDNNGVVAGLGDPGSTVGDSAGDGGPEGEGGDEVQTGDEAVVVVGGEDWGAAPLQGEMAVTLGDILH